MRLRVRRASALAGLLALVACLAASAPPAFALSVPNDALLAVDHAGGRIYWATSGAPAAILSARLDGTDVRTLNTGVATVSDVRGIALDPGGGRVYWESATSDPAVPMVSFAKLDGSGGADIPAPGAHGFQSGLAIADGTAYWMSNEPTRQDISLADLHGGGGVLQMTPAHLGIVLAGGVAIDPGKRIYWVTFAAPVIASANLDGSDTKQLSISGITMQNVSDLHVDTVNRRLYWTNILPGSDQRFAYINLDGSGGGEFVVPDNGRSDTFTIDAEGGRIYWARSGGELWSVNVDGTDAKPVGPPVDASLHAPVIDDAPPSSTPLTDASLLYHAFDKSVTLLCSLDGAARSACTGHTDYMHLALGRHCFSVVEQRNGAIGSAAQACWTVTQLAPGCSASFHHGYFVTAGAVTLARRTVVFHATTDGAAGRIELLTTSKSKIRVTYQLDGHALSSGSRATLAYAQLDRTRSHTLTVTVTSGGRRARIVRRFRYASFVAIACGGRRVVGRIAPRTVRVGGGAVTISAQVPTDIRGTTKLRFLVADRSHVLRAARFTFAGKALTQHALNAALTAQQLQANGSQTLTVALVPKRGRAVTVRIAFRTRST